MISGFLYKPPAKFTGKRPVLVDIHGGPEGQSQPRFSGTQQLFAERTGIALIYPNVRGSTGYGKTFSLLETDLSAKTPTRTLTRCLIGSRRSRDWIASGSR